MAPAQDEGKPGGARRDQGPATAQQLRELDSDDNSLMGRFGGELENRARGEAETRRRKTITLPLAGCSVAFHIPPARLDMDDSALEIAATLGFMKAPTPNLVAFRKHAQEQLEQTGEVIPGAVLRPAEEKFRVVLPKAKESAPEGTETE